MVESIIYKINRVNRMRKTQEVILILLFVIIIFLLIGSFFNEPSTRTMIENANYCQTDNDCINVDFGCPFGCGDYINKAEENKLKKSTLISILLHPIYLTAKCRCEPPPSGAVCTNSICIAKICEIGKNYQFKSFKDRECGCPSGTITNINGTGMFCSPK